MQDAGFRIQDSEFRIQKGAPGARRARGAAERRQLVHFNGRAAILRLQMSMGPAPAAPHPAPESSSRPRRSANVSLGLALFVASSLVTCGPSVPQRCVDQDGRVVDDNACRGVLPTGHRPGTTYRWYYGGTGFGRGAVVHGGSYTPMSGTSVHSSTTRGGFGSSAAAHGSTGHA
jgi:hypothetical protein